MSSQNSVRSSFGSFLVRKKRLKNFPCWDSCFWFSTLHINLECKALSIPTYHENGQVKDWNGNWVQHTMVDLGFPRGRGGYANLLFGIFLRKQPENERLAPVPSAPLDPPLASIYTRWIVFDITSWHADVPFKFFFRIALNQSEEASDFVHTDRTLKLCSHVTAAIAVSRMGLWQQVVVCEVDRNFTCYWNSDANKNVRCELVKWFHPPPL